MTPQTTAAGVNDPPRDADEGPATTAPFLAEPGPAPAAVDLPAVGGGTPTAGTGVLVVGLDLSLVATGIAHLRGGEHVTDTLPMATLDGIVRLRRIREVIGDLLSPTVALVVVEGPSYGSVGAGQHERGGLWWIVRDLLWTRNLPTAVVPPSSLKLYATGKGNAGKDAMLLAAARRWPTFAGGNDEADALWLAAMGADALGCGHVVPEAHRKALGKVTWPAVGAGVGQASGA